MDNNHLYDLTARLRSVDNDIRKAAEAEYNELLSTQSIPIMCFFSEAAATTDDEGTKGLLLVLLRKILNMEPSPYTATDVDSQNRIKQYMLHILETAAYGSQRKNAAACVASLAVLVDKNKQTWSELWENIFHIIGAGDSPNELKVVSCLIISDSCIAMKTFFETHVDAVVQGLHNCLVAEGQLSKEAKSEALNAMSNLADTGLSHKLTPLVPLMLNLIENSLNTHDWPLCESILECICDAVSRSSVLFEASRVQILTGLMQIASSFEVPQNVRQLAVETLVVFCEEDTKATRKVSQFATSFFTLLFQYLLEPTVSDNWDTVDDITEMDDYDDLPDDIMAASALDRVASALGGRTLLATTRQLFGEHVNGADWKQRNAAMVLMCYVVEGMAPVLEKNAKDIVLVLLQHTKDENKVVRCNALQALTEFCSNLEQIFMEHHANILPVVFECLRDPVPRVVYTACTLIDTFFDHCKLDEEDDDDDIAEQKVSERFGPYAEAVCAQCVEIIENSPYSFVRSSALSALSSYLFIARTFVSPYTDRLVHVFQSVLTLPDSQETMPMKNKALQCVTLLATAVGKDTFAPYARDVCEYLKHRCEVGLKPDEDSRYVLRGFACMVDCLGEDSLSYLSVVMPILMKRMGEQCDVVIMPDLGDDNEPEEEGVETVRYKVSRRRHEDCPGSTRGRSRTRRSPRTSSSTASASCAPRWRPTFSTLPRPRLSSYRSW
ncbi:hypothetical protein STCU_09485 [Strigomonas culicis]|uniref:TOG domain-containing protein n=1 Tax=Strigomonas culicis TaxID=28005 RepID=S9UXT4_9TRYP|nr:hypothetical protein STCU_09485 [Strigomonas culicis]|eukprot:EPY19391.1 hypothetical protein STCU_09485 [Strigomonas culicis]